MEVEIVAKNTCKSIGEGPLWDEKSKSLLYVDMYSGDLHRWKSETGQDECSHLSAAIFNVIVPQKTGGYIVNQNNSLAHFNLESNKLETLHTVEEEQNHSFNDGKCDSSGRFWVGTFTLMDHKNPGDFEKGKSALYSLETDGSIVQRLTGVSLSNGITWSLDNKIMYYIDSFAFQIVAFDFDIQSGNISNKRCVVKFSPERGFLDGMTIDTDGKLWVAVYKAGKVFQFDPETGNELTSITIPGAMCITSCCFGGTNYDELYVTTAKLGLSENELLEQPNAGSLFRVTGLGAKGFPAFKYGA